MFVVAITRWGAPPAASPQGAAGGPSGAGDAEVQALAEHLKLSAYDARMRMAGALPAVLESTPDAARAEALRARFAELGHGVVACDAQRVVTLAHAPDARQVAFEEDAFVCTPRGGAPIRVAYPELLALVRARTRSDLETTTEKTTKKFSLGAAAISGGLVMRKKETRIETASARSEHQELYVFQRTARDTLILVDDRLDYAGLGQRKGRTTIESFQALCDLFVERAPDALFDDRMVRAPRRGSLDAVGRDSGATSATTSNQGETDLAAHLLAVARFRGQL